MTATDNPPAAGGGKSELCVVFRAALIIAVGRSLYSSRGYCLCCCQFYTAGGKWCENNANVDGDIELLTQLDIPCATELTFSVVAAAALLVTTFPFRGVGALLKRLATLVLPIRRIPGLIASASADEGEEAADKTPRMTAELEAVVTEEDVARFLSDLANAPTELEAEEAAAAAAAAPSSAEEVMSGMGGSVVRGASAGAVRECNCTERSIVGGAAAGIGVERVPSSAAGEVEGGEWSILHRGSTGTGTTYRMLRRNGPAPGTTEGGERGLAQFRLEAVMEGVTAAQLARVQMNDLVRAQWDTSLLHGDQLAVSEPKGASSSTDGSELAFWRMKFPMPMAPRDYLFVRRRWQAEDGAFYGVTRDATGTAGGGADSLAAALKISGGGYRVRRLYSGQRIRSVTITPGRGFSAGGGYSDGTQQQQQVQRQPPRPASSSTSSSGASQKALTSSAPAAELVSIYHEDSGVPAAVIALAACKGLLPFMRNLEAAARGSLGTEGAGTAAGRRGGAGIEGVEGHCSRLRWRLFGAGKDSSSSRRSSRGGLTGWPSRFSRFSRSSARGDVSADGPKGGFCGENAVRVGRFGFRQSTKCMLSKLKDGIHRTVHKTATGHENIHAEGRRRKLMVRAAGLVAMMAHVKKNRSS